MRVPNNFSPAIRCGWYGLYLVCLQWQFEIDIAVIWHWGWGWYFVWWSRSVRELFQDRVWRLFHLPSSPLGYIAQRHNAVRRQTIKMHCKPKVLLHTPAFFIENSEVKQRPFMPFKGGHSKIRYWPGRGWLLHFGFDLWTASDRSHVAFALCYDRWHEACQY